MKRVLYFFIAVLVAVSIIGIAPSNSGRSNIKTYALENVDCVPNQLVIGYDDDTHMEAISDTINTTFGYAY